MTYDFSSYGDNIWLVGDIHGQPTNVAEAVADEDIRDAAIIIVGDIGLGFGIPNNHVGPIPYLHRTAADRNNHYYIFRGNHDNPESWNEEVTADINKKYPNVHHLKDFDEIVLANGKTCLIVPGGISIDRNYAVRFMGMQLPRKRGSQYWENETIDYLKIQEINKHYDYVIAHTGPTPPSLRKSEMIDRITIAYDSELKHDIEIERDAISDIIKKATPEKWINGHYHIETSSKYTQGDREFKEGDTTVINLGIDELRKLD